jgi:translation initiation factor 1
MSRGTKLDLFVGAEIEDGWAELQSPRKSTCHEVREPKQHTLVFKKEKRRGKVVTLVGEFFLDESALAQLLKELKKKLACGGTAKDGFMEFQGELQEKLRTLLEAKEFRFKRK